MYREVLEMAAKKKTAKKEGKESKKNVCEFC